MKVHDDIDVGGWTEAGSAAASGVYYYRIEAVRLSEPAGSFTSVKKMVFLK